MFQPSLGSAEDALVARSVKALFFEAVLNSERHREPGHGMPLVAYVADECHRFVTSDLVHGEQSFLDTCRSFGAFCVLACQSVASLRHALAEANGSSDSTEPAIEIILANSGNKLFFRSTDRDVGERVERLCPRAPGHPGRAVDRLYRKTPFPSDSARLGHLLAEYEKMVAPIVDAKHEAQRVKADQREKRQQARAARAGATKTMRVVSGRNKPRMRVHSGEALLPGLFDRPEHSVNPQGVSDNEEGVEGAKPPPKKKRRGQRMGR